MIVVRSIPPFSFPHEFLSYHGYVFEDCLRLLRIKTSLIFDFDRVTSILTRFPDPLNLRKRNRQDAKIDSPSRSLLTVPVSRILTIL